MYIIKIIIATMEYPYLFSILIILFGYFIGLTNVIAIFTFYKTCTSDNSYWKALSTFMITWSVFGFLSAVFYVLIALSYYVSFYPNTWDILKLSIISGYDMQLSMQKENPAGNVCSCESTSRPKDRCRCCQ